MTTDEIKNTLRSMLRSKRASISDPAVRSERIVTLLMALPQMQTASSIAFFASIRDEVQTDAVIASCLGGRHRISLPVVVGERLELFEIQSINEMQPGSFRVPEPTPTIRNDAGRYVDPTSVELIVVPGLGFDTRGGRIGYGRGFYDRLLGEAPQAVTVALAYECQIVEEVPMSKADVRVDFVVTEDRVIDCNESR